MRSEGEATLRRPAARRTVTVGFHSLYDTAVLFYFLTLLFANGTLIFRVAVVFLYAVGVLDLLIKKRLTFSWHCAFILLFILFNALMIGMDMYVYKAAALERLRSVILNYLCCLFVFFYAVDRRNRRLLMKGYCVLAAGLIAYILVMNGRSAFSMRFGAGTPYLFSLRGTSGQTFNTNSVAIMLFAAFSFALYFLWESGEMKNASERRKWIAALVIFGVFTLLTGSRKGVLMIAVFLTVAYFLRSGDILKKTKRLLIVAAVMLVVYYLIMHVDALYRVVGYRLEILIDGLLSDEGFQTRTSAYYRNRMQELGWDLFLQNPVIGWGLDSYAQMVFFDTYSHNNFIEILVSSGIIGFLLYYGAVAVNLFPCFRFFSRDYSRNESVILFAYSLASLLAHVGLVQYVDRCSISLAFVAAAAITDWKQNAREKPEV